MASHSSTLAWKIPWTEESGRLQSMALQRVGHDSATSLLLLKTLIQVVSQKSESHSVVSDSLRPYGLYSPWNSPGQNTGVDSLSLLQGIFQPGPIKCDLPSLSLLRGLSPSPPTPALPHGCSLSLLHTTSPHRPVLHILDWSLPRATPWNKGILPARTRIRCSLSSLAIQAWQTSMVRAPRTWDSAPTTQT